MKRTVEKILTWIGIILQFILIFIMAIVTPFLNDASVKDSLIETINNSNKYNQASTQMSPSQLLDVASGLFLIALAAVIICTIIAIIVALLINKLPKFSGVVLILIAIVTFFTFNWITALLWLIAGIMLLVRKSTKHKNEDLNHFNNAQSVENNASFSDQPTYQRRQDREDK